MQSELQTIESDKSTFFWVIQADVLLHVVNFIAHFRNNSCVQIKLLVPPSAICAGIILLMIARPFSKNSPHAYFEAGACLWNEGRGRQFWG